MIYPPDLVYFTNKKTATDAYISPILFLGTINIDIIGNLGYLCSRKSKLHFTILNEWHKNPFVPTISNKTEDSDREIMNLHHAPIR